MNASAVLILTMVIWAVAAIGQAPIPWLLAGILISIAFRYYAVKNRKELPSRDPLLLIALFPSIALTLYAAMFSIIDVKSYLESNDQGQYAALLIGSNFIFAMLLGGALQLLLRNSSNARPKSVSASPSYSRAVLLFAWIPIAIATLCYFIFFAGKEYVEIHSNVPILANILLKTIYLSYAATFLIASSESIAEFKRKRHVLMLLVGHIFVFAILFKLRSPAIFFAFMTLFLIGYTISKKIIVIAAATAPLALSAIALARDPSLIDTSLEQSIVILVVTFGEFVDALRFAEDYVASSGPLWGVGIIGSFLGTTEPLANIYAKSISEDYFDSGGGFGFFMLADIFANFGLIAGTFFSIGFGYFLSKMGSSKFGTTTSFISCILFASALALTRNDFGSTLRGVFYCIFAFILVQALTRRSKK